jgi:hypothetical protein
MKHSSNIYEKQIAEIWKSQSFQKSLSTVQGEEIHVLDIGLENDETGGPDFKNARVRIGNLVYVGDIEIDQDYSNWKSHAHNIDEKYNKVILHAALSNKFNQNYVYTKNGRKVPTICLSRFLSKESYNHLVVSDEKVSNNNILKCAHCADSIEERIKRDFISKLGMERFNKKCKRIYSRLKEITYLKSLKLHEPVVQYDLKQKIDEKKFTHEDFQDKEIWQQLLYEMVFEALGYSKNKGIMLKLAQAVPVEFYKRLGSDKDAYFRIEATLFNVSGLVPDKILSLNDNNSNYPKQILKEWDNLKRIYDGKIFSEADWQFFRLRPQNFPTVRLAGGAQFLKLVLYENLIESINKKIIEIRNVNVLINSIRTMFVLKSRGYWKDHYVFGKASKENVKYFVGVARADEIMINVILPFFAVYYEVFGKDELAKKIIKTYSIYPQKSDNKIVRDIAEGLNNGDYLKKTVLSQGLLELFRSYCSKKKCLDCEIGSTVFS